MRCFRRDEDTLNEQLLREAGLATPENLGETVPAEVESEPEPPSESLEPRGPADPQSRPLLTGRWQERSTEWHTFVTAEAPGLHGDDFEFAAVPDGSLIVDASVNDDLSPLADAVERELRPPYRAVAVRQGRELWSISARQIEVVEARYEGGDELEIACYDGARSFKVDGTDAAPRDAPPTLVALGESRGAAYCVQARRLDGDLWDATAEPL